MYNLKALFTKNPIQISGVIMSAVNLLVILDWWALSADAIAGLNIFLTGALGLFVVGTTTNTAKLDELNDDAGAVELSVILTILQCVFFVVAICWFVKQLGWFT